MEEMNKIERIKYDDACVCIFKNDYSSDELLRFFDAPEVYLAELEQFTGEKRKKEFLGLRYALKKCFDNQEYIVVYNEEGKPLLENNPTYHISFSHAAHWNVAAYSHKKIGIDIEIPTERLRKVSKKFLSEKEQEDFPANTDLETLCLIWSCKEVMFKIIGNDAIDFAKQLRIYPFEKKSEGEIKALHLVTGKIYFLQYKISPAFVIVLGIEK